MANSRINKVMVLGLDGATFIWLKPWIKEGKLPHLGRLLESGVHGYLRSVIHPFSPPAWSSFMTGKNPGKHGVFDFLIKAPNSYVPKLASAQNRRSKTLWRILSEAGKRVCIINVPMTYPPEPVNGYLVSWLAAPGDHYNYTHPPELKEEIHQVLGGYAVRMRLSDYIPRHKMDKLRHDIDEMTDNQCALAKYLFAKEPYDFFMVVFEATDRVQHNFWRYADPSHPLYTAKDAVRHGDAIFAVYRKIDQTIGELVAKADDNTTIIVMSDHGFGGDSTKVIYLNRWLEHIGMLRFLDSADHLPLSWKGWVVRANAFVLSHALYLFKRFAPIRLKRKLRNIGRVRSAVETTARCFGIDWRHTKAYSDEYRGNIWINVRGREPQGIVEPGQEYEQVREDIIQQLRELKDPYTGEPIMAEVYRREEVYQGPCVDLTPDIVFVHRGWVSRNGHDYNYVYRRTRASRQPSWLRNYSPEQLRRAVRVNASHRMDGILIMSGRGVDTPKEAPRARILDLAPTILHLLGLPIPSDMDGKVLMEALDSSLLAAHPIRYTGPCDEEHLPPAGSFGYTPEETTKMEELLRGLGYIE